MGTLADMLNIPLVIEIGGQDYNLRRLSLSELCSCLQAGLRELDPEMKGMALQDATQAALESGQFPRQAIDHIVYAAMSGCNDGFDMSDARAISTVEHIELATDIVMYAACFQDNVGEKKAQAAQQDKKSRSTGKS